MQQIKRLTAKKVRISDILNSNYFPGSKEDMKPSYVITPFGQKISRVNLVGTITEKFDGEDSNYSSVTIDDGTDAIRVKTFGEGTKILANFGIGNLVLVIGKVKEYTGELYVNGEVVKKVEPNYESLRKLEILDSLIEQKKIVEEIKKLREQMSEEELLNYVKRFDMDVECLQTILENLKVVKNVDYKPKILELIASLDEGDGVEIGKILDLSDLPENVIEKAINELLASGDIFEPIVGRLRKV
jgi:RPA family protein